MNLADEILSDPLEELVRHQTQCSLTRSVLLVALFCGACNTSKSMDDDPEIRAARIAASRAAQLKAVRETAPAPVPLAAYRYRREISMFYRIDLAANNSHAAGLASVMRAYDEPIRACYADRLETIPNLTGDLLLSFALLKSSSNVSQIVRIGGSITDLATISCVMRRVGDIHYQSKRDLLGKVHYHFSYVDKSDGGRGGIEPLATSTTHPPKPRQALDPASSKQLPPVNKLSIEAPSLSAKPLSAAQNASAKGAGATQAPSGRAGKAVSNTIAKPAIQAMPAMSVPSSAAKPGGGIPSSAAKANDNDSTSASTNHPKSESQADSKENSRGNCRGCRVQDLGNQQIQAVTQKRNPTNDQRSE